MKLRHTKAEIFVPVRGYNGLYEVSNFGNVRSNDRVSFNGRTNFIKKGRLLKKSKSVDGYEVLNLCINGNQKLHTVHSLVAKSFIGDVPSGFTVNHKDGDKANNHLSNLEIVSYAENNIHALDHGLRSRKIQASDVPQIKSLFDSGNTKTEIAKRYNVNIKTIDNVLQNKLRVCAAHH